MRSPVEIAIVCDQDPAITNGINKHWGAWAATNLVHYCEHHLGGIAKRAFESDKIPAGDPVRELFKGALKARERWDAFAAEVNGRPTLSLTASWVKKNDVMLRGQTQGRSRIPPIYANGAVEQALLVLKTALSPRTFTFRNRGRLNLLLVLMVLAHRKVDNVTDYSTDIRAYLDRHNGHPQRTYRDMYDRKADPSGEVRLNSLWSVAAQLAMIEVRTRRSASKTTRFANPNVDGL